MRSDDVESFCQFGELVTGLAAVVADPAQDELAADEVVADLFWRVLLGVEEDRQGLVVAVPGAVGAGDFDPVSDSAFEGQC